MSAPETGVVIEYLGGNCPVQAEGTFDGVRFYFRARGESISCEVGPNVPSVAKPDWMWIGPRKEWPTAGWISKKEARAFIEEAYVAWKAKD